MEDRLGRGLGDGVAEDGDGFFELPRREEPGAAADELAHGYPVPGRPASRLHPDVHGRRLTGYGPDRAGLGDVALFFEGHAVNAGDETALVETAFLVGSKGIGHGLGLRIDHGDLDVFQDVSRGRVLDDSVHRPRDVPPEGRTEACRADRNRQYEGFVGPVHEGPSFSTGFVSLRFFSSASARSQ